MAKAATSPRQPRATLITGRQGSHMAKAATWPECQSRLARCKYGMKSKRCWNYTSASSQRLCLGADTLASRQQRCPLPPRQEDPEKDRKAQPTQRKGSRCRSEGSKQRSCRGHRSRGQAALWLGPGEAPNSRKNLKSTSSKVVPAITATSWRGQATSHEAPPSRACRNNGGA